MLVTNAHIALQDHDDFICPSTNRALSFNGRCSVAIPPGAPMVSDPVELAIPPGGKVAVSLFVERGPAALTLHDLALETSYLSRSGNHADSLNVPDAETTGSWYFLVGIEVLAVPSIHTIAAFGDSITDGYRSTAGTDRRWPDVMAQRLRRAYRTLSPGVINLGISGNRLLHDAEGQNALARFDSDVLSQAGVRTVILLEGINDVGYPYIPGGSYGKEKVSVENVISAYIQLIQRCHARGVRLVGCTLTPFEKCAYYSSDGEVIRQAVNEWIRSSNAFDGVIDFDAALRDASRPSRLEGRYDSGDHLHPNDEGYRRMGEFVDIDCVAGGGLSCGRASEG